MIKAAEADPEHFGDLAKRLDEEGAHVDPIYREMRQRQKPPEPEPPVAPPPTDDGVVRAQEDQVEAPAPGPALRPHADGPYSAGECDRLRARVDELGGERRMLELKVTALENEVKEAKALLADAMVVIDKSFQKLGHDKHDAAARKEFFSALLFAWWERHIGLPIPESLRRN